MKELLLLTHRIPYPPNKGDKVRSYHLLKHLSERYRVYLGCFVDEPSDWDHVPKVKSMCAESYFARLNPRVARWRSLTGYLSHEPLTLPYYRHGGLRAWVDGIASRGSVAGTLVFSSAMAQYVTRDLEARCRVVDLVDVDSAKWRQYGEKARWPMDRVYRREGRELLRYERRIAQTFDASVFVSRAEADLFRRLAPEASARVTHVNNGVDAEYFSPSHPHVNPFPEGERVIVFTGAMDYWANVDAVSWFVHQVFPSVRAKVEAARFYIVGARPTEAVLALGKEPSVHVTGSVDDIRPYIASAEFAVAPLRIARGVQNKVLEGMAMAKVVLATPAALDGIEDGHDLGALATDDHEQYADRVVGLLAAGDLREAGASNRNFVVRHYNWEDNLTGFDALLELSRTDS